MVTSDGHVPENDFSDSVGGHSKASQASLNREPSVPPNTKRDREVMAIELKVTNKVGTGSHVAEVTERKDSAPWVPIMVTMPA